MAVLRVISDSADSNSKEEFEEFLREYVLNSWELLDCLLKDIPLIPIKFSLNCPELNIENINSYSLI